MKRALLWTCLSIISLVIYSQDKPMVWTDDSVVGEAVTSPGSTPDYVSTLPEGILLWSQGPQCVRQFSSEIISSIGLVTYCADDFELTSDQMVNSVRWWFGMYLEYMPFTEWHIRIYDNANCLPANILYEWTIPFNQSHEEYYCTRPSGYSTYSFWTDLVPGFLATANQTYWISIQAGEHNLPGQWSWDFTNIVNGCEAAFKSDYFGAPDFVPAGMTYLGYPGDFAFELYGNAPAYTPLSGWAIYLAIGLIFAVVIFRFWRLRL